ncbi:unnamed protein product [Rhizoctonia solani]|uniref:Uncharacterized protein n=1 Tax=Rhizoctonia solani TaxID=456999 RepID=A0A8H3B1B6_9AGAM|nr:unnamed protein product [Rhizoctonia solani]
MLKNSTRFPDLIFQMGQPHSTAMILNTTKYSENRIIPSPWFLVFNVAKQISYDLDRCNATKILVPGNITIPHFSLGRLGLNGCYSIAKVKFDAASGTCRDCRVTSYSTVQNETVLEPPDSWENNTAPGYRSVALRDMPKYFPTVTPVKGSLPNPEQSVDNYLIALCNRLYSALWNAWADISRDDGASLSSEYEPAVPTLRAEVNQLRVYAWLALQLSITVSGVIFIWLQSKSEYPLLSDTGMVAFDLDTTEVSRPDGSEKKSQRMMRIEPKGEGWKVVLDREGMDTEAGGPGIVKY